MADHVSAYALSISNSHLDSFQVPAAMAPSCQHLSNVTSEDQSFRPCFNVPVSEPGEMTSTELRCAMVQRATAAVFDDMENQWGDLGSPWRTFYEKAAAMPKRLIAWNTKRYASRYWSGCTTNPTNFQRLCTRAYLFPKRRYRTTSRDG